MDMTCAGLTVLSALVTGIGGDALQPLFTGTPIMEHTLHCGTLGVSEVRAAAFGLLGDLATHMWGYVEGQAEPIFTAARTCMSILTYDTRDAVNNAVWATGIMLRKLPPAQATVLMPKVVGLLAGIVGSDQSTRWILGNAACALGRCAIVAPQLVTSLASHPFEEFFPYWARACTENDTEEERVDAFLGLCMAAGANPMAVAPHLTVLGVALVHYDFIRSPEPHLQSVMSQLLLGFKANMPPAEWAKLWGEEGAWNAPTQQRLMTLGVTP